MRSVIAHSARKVPVFSSNVSDRMGTCCSKHCMSSIKRHTSSSLSKKDLEFLREKTVYDKSTIEEWHEGFLQVIISFDFSIL